jgi:two-component system chemotaxis sensor kinase CheA
MNNDRDLMDIFLEEAHDLIDEMKRDLSSLSEEPNAANLNDLFRCAHTLKSSSGIVGFDNLHELALALEETFKRIKDEKCETDPQLICLLSEGIEACQKLLNGEEVEGYNELLEELGKI